MTADPATDAAMRRHIAESDPDRCGWSKRQFRNGDVTCCGTDRRGRWRTVATENIDVLMEIHAVGIYSTSQKLISGVVGSDATSSDKAVFDQLPRPWKADDAKWFEAHPRRTHRWRPMAPNELDISGAAAQLTPFLVLRQMRPGWRVKQLCLLPPGAPQPPDTDAALSVMFDELARATAEGRRFITTDELAMATARRHPEGAA